MSAPTGQAGQLAAKKMAGPCEADIGLNDSVTSRGRTRPARSLKLVHTSDVHIGCDYARPQVVDDALRSVIDLALREDAAALLIAGDFIDHENVTDGILEFISAELARFGRHTFVLPGNHDVLDERSVYLRSAWAVAPLVHVIGRGNDGTCFIPELGLEVWGSATVRHHRSFEPLRNAPPRRGPHWRVAMAHGHFEDAGDDPRSSPIFPHQIAELQFDYVALGHWDRHTNVSQGDVVAFYSGSPHGQRAGNFALVVTLDPALGVTVRQAPLLPAEPRL